LAVAAFLTAFYTMRQITLTFLGKPRTKAAEHASETTWTMTVPLVVLAVFAVSFGWVGIPEQFPVLGGLVSNWFHAFVGGTLAEMPKEVEFSWIPLITSLTVALGGLFVGWLAYRKVESPRQDFMQIPALKNKWYFDEIYNYLFIKPAFWVAEKFTSLYMDQIVIDGFLHAVARFSLFLGTWFRAVIDKRVINELIGDGTGSVVKSSGSGLRKIQAGRIQYYMVASITVLVIFAILAYFLIDVVH
jgi:NADH-quinone oxidoreductase subunit L